MAWISHSASDSLYRVVVTKALPGDRWLKTLLDAGCDVEVSPSRSILPVTEIRAAIGDHCDGVIGQLTEDWGAELFEALRAAGGKVYANYAVGYDNVDVDAATRCGILVGNTPGVLTETTAEMAVALLFSAARGVPEADRFVRAGKFDGWLPDLFLGKRLWGATLGILGAGRIGACFTRMVAPGHDMHLIYQDVLKNDLLEAHFAAINKVRARAGASALQCEHVTDPDEVLRRADVVSLHVPLDDSTRHLIDARRLKLMKPDAILVNTSRGPVINEADLVAHLRENPGFRVGLDVFENEPALTPGLAEQWNAVIVPHIASATEWTRQGMATLAACNVAAALRGDPMAGEFHVEEFLDRDHPARKAPSIVNAREVGLKLS